MDADSDMMEGIVQLTSIVVGDTRYGTYLGRAGLMVGRPIELTPTLAIHELHSPSLRATFTRRF